MIISEEHEKCLQLKDGTQFGENIRPSIESIPKKVDEKRARMLDPDPFS
jgi:hypothetical protein